MSDATSGLRPWTCPLSTAQLAGVLQCATRWGAYDVALIDSQGTVQVRLGREHEHDVLPSHQSASDVAVDRAPVLARDELVAFVEVTGSAAERGALGTIVQTTATRLAEAWQVAHEIDNLASEIVHAYEELHLLYDLGEALTSQMSVSTAVELIMDKVLSTLPAIRVELHLGETNPVIFTKSVPGSDAHVGAGGSSHVLVTHLKSSGKPVGKIVLVRAGSGEPFSSMESKLLDGVGSIAASALHNAQLFERLCQQADVLREREAHLSTVMDNVAEGIITVTAEGAIDSFNLAAEQVFGYSEADVIGQPFRLLVPDPASEAAEGEGHGHSLLHAAGEDERGCTRQEATGRRKDGTPFLIDLAINEMRLDSLRVFIVSVRDITERKRWEQALEHQALHDALTDLPNRSLLHDRLKQTILARQRASKSLALLIMDLDHFKEVNDTLGHQAGDLLLQQVGPRLRGTIRASDTIARLGGDEFAVLLPGADAGGASLVALEILQALDKPFIVEDHSLTIGASIGIALCPEHGEDAGTLLRHADVAMYVAKRSHAGYSIYAAERDYHSPSRLELKGELRAAIDREQMVLYYQPQVDFRTHCVARVEALVRWQHPERGLVLPAQFISLAEQTGLIDGLSHWIIDAALRQCKGLIDSGQEVSVAVNLSAQNLHDPRLPDMIGRLLSTRGVPPALLKVEITESSLMADPVRALKVLTRLSTMGVRIGIDDFGTGYSSLAYLKRLPVHEIKIDKSFVLHMAQDESDEAIVRSTISLGHDLGLLVVAEGVETPQTWTLLSDLGCDLGQGYYLSRPIPGNELALWLQDSPWSRVGKPPLLSPVTTGADRTSMSAWVRRSSPGSLAADRRAAPSPFRPTLDAHPRHPR
jgi:diguanylate cyclase (GGDEF)-like protein/PAS domain S-box-containing protein